ncbi:MAG: RiPP maturation radical SAM protein 1, partial [Vicinamibacteria bacterium]|nr:RiPP maturation radical SAM protein 1 [Vicinamibacteria bacterium]
MPFGPLFAPSLGLSLLKAGLARAGIGCRVRYFTLPFAERIGQHFYSGLASEGRPTNRDLAGEWIFGGTLFPPDPERDARYLDDVLRRRSTAPEVRLEPPASEALVRRIVAARDHVPGFLDACLAEILAAGPRLVGFTSIFQQHVASLALARRLKQASPATFVVFGGANCEGPMGAETVRQFPFVDAVVSGEADLVFPELVRRVLA